MRSLLLAALGITAFSATMAVETPEANAVVYCAAGVYRAGCVARPVAPVARAVARPGTVGNRNGGVNRVGRRR